MNKKTNRLRSAVEAKRSELIELFKSMGQEALPCGRDIKNLTLSELQDLMKKGIRK